MARLLAPSQDVVTGEWFSAAALRDAVTDYVSVLFWVSGFALLGMTLAVLVRSIPVALAIGIAWAGPFEHLLQDAWDPANRLFPGSCSRPSSPAARPTSAPPERSSPSPSTSQSQPPSPRRRSRGAT
jgi:hypothetical protein